MSGCQTTRSLKQLTDMYVLAHKDCLVRFGYGYFEVFCERHNTGIIVMNGEALSPEQERGQDLLALVTVFASRLHGLILMRFLARLGPHTGDLVRCADVFTAIEDVCIHFERQAGYQRW